MSRRIPFAIAVVLLAALAAQAFASGGGKITTRLTIEFDRNVDQDVIFGKVRSKEHACEADRTVKLHHRTVKYDQDSTVIDRPRTNSKGKWTFKPKPNSNGDRFATPGYYHVKVSDKKISTGHGEIVCKGRSSSALLVG